MKSQISFQKEPSNKEVASTGCANQKGVQNSEVKDREVTETSMRDGPLRDTLNLADLKHQKPK